MTRLPAKGSRARARAFDIFEDHTYGCGSTACRVWFVRADGVESSTPLEGWFDPVGAENPKVGRIRTLPIAEPGMNMDTSDLKPLIDSEPELTGIAEILNIELEPVFFGQGLGVRLIRASLADVPGEWIVACQPKPTEFQDIDVRDSMERVVAFYRRLGMAVDRRLPGYLTARRSGLTN